jgi:hypothetical protein
MQLFEGKTGVIKLTALLIVLCSVSSESRANGRDTIFIQKHNIVKSHHISLYPDANQEVVFFSVKGVQGKVYQLYLFDVDGKLVRQAETRNKQTTILKDIENGVYFFEVFSDDMRIGNGQIAIR